MSGVDSGPKPGGPELDKDGMLVIPKFEAAPAADQTPGPKFESAGFDAPVPAPRDPEQAEADARKAVAAAPVAPRGPVTTDVTGYHADADGYTSSRVTGPQPVSSSYKEAYGIKDPAQAEPPKPTGFGARARAFVSRLRGGGQPRG